MEIFVGMWFRLWQGTRLLEAFMENAPTCLTEHTYTHTHSFLLRTLFRCTGVCHSVRACHGSSFELFDISECSTVGVIFPLTSLLCCLYWPWDPLSSLECTPVSIQVPKQVDCNMCWFMLLFFSPSVGILVIHWWDRPLTLVVFFFVLCLLLLTWSIAGIACRACH